MKVAIIGMGVAGTSVLREWTKMQKQNPSIQITVFGDKETFGSGKAFQQDDPGLLMNQVASLTSIVPENPNDFVDWIKINHNDKHPESKFYPRAEFRSEERRVGKECRYGWWRDREKIKNKQMKVEDYGS